MGKIAPNPRQRNKAIAFDYDFIRAQAVDTCLYCLNDQQVAAIQTMLEYLGWKTRWFSLIDTAIDADWIKAFEAELEVSFMADVCTEITDKLNHIETQITELETDLDVSQAAQDVAIGAVATEVTALSAAVALLSTAIAGIATIVTSTQGTVNEMSDDVDNVETIVTASATEITETGTDVDNIELLTIKNKGNITNIYNQNTLITITLAVPNQTYVADTTDNSSTATIARYNAFCTAIVQWIYAEIYAVMSALNANPTDLATLALQMNATSLSLEELLSTGTPYTVAQVYAAVSDTSAVNDVACAMITALTALKPSQETFATALTAYTPPAYPDHRAILRDTLQISLTFIDAFTVFASIYQDAYATTLAAAPTTYVCAPCGTINPGCGYQTWDFTIGQKSPWTFNRGIYVPGQGLVGVQVPGDAGYAFEANLVFPGGCKPTATTYIHFYLAGLASGVNNSFYYETYAMVSGVETLQEYAFYISQYPGPYITSKEWTFGPLVNYKTLSRIRMVSNTYFNTPSGGNWVTPTYSALRKVVFNAVP